MDALFALFVIVMIIGVYWIPTFLAFDRNVPSAWSIAVINCFLGWTLVGWVVALALAVRTVPHKESTT